MDRLDRIFHLYQVLRDRRQPVPGDELRERLECSQATLNRDVAFLRDMLGAPIHTYRSRGFLLDSESDFELPGLWFSADELRALLTVQSLLRELGEGLLDEHIRPLEEQIQRLLERVTHRGDPRELTTRLRFQPVFRRAATHRPGVFATVASTTLERQRLDMEYHSRGKDETRWRRVSPQRLIHYRDNWYLDAWSHTDNGLRRYAVDRIRRAHVNPEPCLDLPAEQIDQHDHGFGIFAGREVRYAKLRFSAERARWVADELWHKDQVGERQPDGSYLLTLPYTDSRELLGDILRHGSHVEVLSPPELRVLIRREIVYMAAKYSGSEQNAP